MAGAGAKLFVDGTILDAVGINTYLMDQTVMRFASTTARDAAFGGSGEPVLAEGMFAYTNDTNTLWFYTGSAWEVATIKPSLVDAKGDLIAGTAADTVDRLAVGTNGQVLTANSSASTGLAWANAGGLVPIVPTSVTVGGGTATVGTNGQVTFTSVTTSLSLNGIFSSAYNNYRIIFRNTYASDGDLSGRLRASGTDTSTNYTRVIIYANGSTVYAQSTTDTNFLLAITSAATRTMAFDIFSPFLTSITSIIGTEQERNTAGTGGILNFASAQTGSTSFDGFTFLTNTAQTGTVSVYGYTI